MQDKVTITNKQLLDISGSLNALAGEKTSAWYPIVKNLRKIEHPLDVLFKAKEKMFRELGETDAEGNLLYLDPIKKQVKFKEGRHQEAEKLWSDIQDETIDIDFHKFDMSLLQDMKLVPGMLTPLLDVIIIEK